MPVVDDCSFVAQALSQNASELGLAPAETTILCDVEAARKLLLSTTLVHDEFLRIMLSPG